MLKPQAQHASGSKSAFPNLANLTSSWSIVPGPAATGVSKLQQPQLK